ncbi:MAG TPA: hypothetical protein PLA77_10265 [Bacteroidales bacterium]|nr:hypothetical protein [Bacteroidales bacterium]
MSYINLEQNASYNFKAPSIDADADTKVEVVFPTQEAQSPTVTETTAIEINRQTTAVNLGELAASITLNATIGSDVERGAKVMVKASSGAVAKDVTFGTGFTSPTMAGTINKSKAMTFMYDGSAFIPVAAAVTLN